MKTLTASLLGIGILALVLGNVVGGRSAQEKTQLDDEKIGQAAGTKATKSPDGRAKGPAAELATSLKAALDAQEKAGKSTKGH